MSKVYNHLGSAQRYRIEAFIKAGLNQKEIAEKLDVHPSTICREIRRNTPKRGCLAGVYDADNAQRRTHLRHSTKPKHRIFDHAMKQTIRGYLENEKWSPQLISQCHTTPMVSHEWIYQWIWSCKFSNKRKDRQYKALYEYLRHGRRRRKRGIRKDNRGIIPNRTPIEMRPAIVGKRRRIGDLEVDLMMGKKHKGAILVMTDRATLHTKLLKLQNKESETVYEAAVKCLMKSNYPIRTLTFDNDKAFSGHENICDKLGAKSYFTRPYTSQDKGTVENRIGVLRRFFPKGIDLTRVTQHHVTKTEDLLNNRPVKKFNYLTPNQVLQGKIALIT